MFPYPHSTHIASSRVRFKLSTGEWAESRNLQYYISYIRNYIFSELKQI